VRVCVCACVHVCVCAFVLCLHCVVCRVRWTPPPPLLYTPPLPPQLDGGGDTPSAPPVLFQDRLAYAAWLEDVHLHEAWLQLRAVQHGLSEVSITPAMGDIVLPPCRRVRLWALVPAYWGWCTCVCGSVRMCGAGLLLCVGAIAQIVPLHALSVLTWSELETLVCGSLTVDVDMLSRHTGAV
jgi:hypothetical protein